MKNRGAVQLVVLCFALMGCSLFKSRSPTATIFPTGKIVAGGDAATPAHVNETVTHAAMQVPAASTITTSPADGSIKVQVSQATGLTVDTKQTKVDGPVAFTPPAPPTPTEKAQGTAFLWFMGAGLILLLIAAWLAYATHYLAAIKFAAAGIAMPILARFFSSQVALVAGSILVTAGIVFVIAWYIIESKKKAVTPVAPAPVPLPIKPLPSP